MRNSAVLFLLITIISSCHFMGGRRVRGNGNLTAQTRNVGTFTGVRAIGGMDVVLTPGTDYSVKVEADENLMKYILTENNDGVVSIRTRNNVNLRPTAGMKIYVTAPKFESIAVTGSGSVISTAQLTGGNQMEVHVTGSGDVALDLNMPRVRAETTGSGNIKLRGTTQQFEVSISGSGDIRCYDLLSEATKVSISGSGNAQVYASKNLDVHISGAGDVAYKGQPAINQRIAGSGSVHSTP